MQGHQANSVQAEWIARQQHPLRRAFPGFAATFDGLRSACGLCRNALGAERGVLLATALGLVTVTLSVTFVAGFFDVSGSSQAAVIFLPLVFIGLAGAWSSVGRGAWHWRLALAVLAAAWLVASYFSAVDMCGNMQNYINNHVVTAASVVFALCAFAAALVRSVSGQELAGPIPTQTTALPRGQFSIRTLLWSMLLVAVLLGLWQASRAWSSKLEFDLDDLQYHETRRVVALATSICVMCLLVGFRRWWVLLLALLVVVLGLATSDFLGLTAQATRRFSLFQNGLLYPACLALISAISTIVWLRWCGFRLQPASVDDRRRS